MRTIAVVNQKGGCGKTITSINLAAFLARARRRVLVVDMDPQGHATLGLVSGRVESSRTMHDVFLAKADQRTGLRDIICKAHQNLDVAPADILLSTVPETLAGTPGREDILAGALAELEGSYDYIIIDCPPNVGLLTFNALKACSEAIIPMDPSFFSLHGVGKLLETFDMLAKDAGHEITPRVLVTLFLARSPFVKAVVEEIHNHLPGQYFETVIRHSVKLSEAASHGVPIVDYCRHCAGFEDYQALAAEVLQNGEGTSPETITFANSIQTTLRKRIADRFDPHEKRLREAHRVLNKEKPDAETPSMEADPLVRALVEFDQAQEQLGREEKR